MAPEKRALIFYDLQIGEFIGNGGGSSNKERNTIPLSSKWTPEVCEGSREGIEIVRYWTGSLKIKHWPQSTTSFRPWYAFAIFTFRSFLSNAAIPPPLPKKHCVGFCEESESLHQETNIFKV
eukprot:scaffold4715_cov115-Cylindrotheca_fusiformis.AAC.16